MSLDWTNAVQIKGSDGEEYTAAILPCGHVGFGVWQHPNSMWLVSVLEGDQVRVADDLKVDSFDLGKMLAETIYEEQAASWLVLDRMGPPKKKKGREHA